MKIKLYVIYYTDLYSNTLKAECFFPSFENALEKINANKEIRKLYTKQFNSSAQIKDTCAIQEVEIPIELVITNFLGNDSPSKIILNLIDNKDPNIILGELIEYN